MSSAVMMLHPVRMTGQVIGAPQTYRYFARTQQRIMEFITDHSAVSGESIDLGANGIFFQLFDNGVLAATAANNEKVHKGPP